MKPEFSVTLSSAGLVSGLQHYRSLAKQDILMAEVAPSPDTVRSHAESRLAVYGMLLSHAETESPEEVVRLALRLYEQTPLVTTDDSDQYVRLVAREHALENVFVLVGLSPAVRQHYWRLRPRMVHESALSS
jgi:hypothetical protein